MNIEGTVNESNPDSTFTTFEFNMLEKIEKDLDNLSNLLEKSSEKEKFQNSHLQEVACKVEELQRENGELKHERDVMMKLLEELTSKLAGQISLTVNIKKTHDQQLMELQGQHMNLMNEMASRLTEATSETMSMKLKIVELTNEAETLKREKKVHLKAIKELAEHQSQINNKILSMYTESVELHKDFSIFEIKKKLERAEEERKLLEKLYIEQTGNKNVMRDIRKQVNSLIASKDVQVAVKKNKKIKAVKKLEEINLELECKAPRKTRGRKASNKRDESNKENLGETGEQRQKEKRRGKMEEEDSREEEDDVVRCSDSSGSENEEDSDFMKEEAEAEGSEENSSGDESKKRGAKRKKISQNSNEKQTTQGKGKGVEGRKPKREKPKNLKEISMMAMNSIQHDLFSN